MIHEKLRPFAAFIGIDWADKKHDICLWTPEATKREHLVLEHKPKAIQAWAEGLRKRFAGAPVAVCIELSHGPIVSALLEHDFFVLFPVEPTTLARYRTAFKPSRAKDDPTDAERALDIVLTHPEKFSPLEPDSGRMRSLRRLVESRRGLVHDRTRITNRITNALKQYFPQPLAWFREKDTALFAAFLERWPSLEDVQAADDDTLRAFFREHNVRYKATVERRIAAIRDERPLHSDTAIIGPARLLLETLLVQLRAVSSAIARFDEEITRLAAELPDYDLFAKLPGAGPSLAPRLLVAFGERRERFPDAASLQKYAGIAPVTERSGNKSWVHWRFSCPSSCGRRSSSGSRRRSLARSGRRSTTNRCGLVARNTKPLSGLSRSSGSASCIAVGRIASPTTRPSISTPSESVTRRCSPSPPRRRRTKKILAVGLRA